MDWAEKPMDPAESILKRSKFQTLKFAQKVRYSSHRSMAIWLVSYHISSFTSDQVWNPLT